MMRRLPLMLLCTGCVIGGDKYPRPRDLSPKWLVDRTRVLAVIAEPPEIRPGERATFSALIPAPGGEELVKIWLACPEDDESSGLGCVTDFGSLDLENATPEELAALGFIGVEPGLPPAYQAPADFLDALEEEERAEGRYVNIQVTALPASLLEATTGAAAPELDFNEVEAAYKRLVVSEALTPNHNPGIRDFLVDRWVVPAGAEVEVEADQDYEIGITLPDGAREVYTFVNSDGEAEDRVEEPYAAWFATGGTIQEEVTLYPYLEATWTAPEGAESGTWYVVLRDRRGGQAVWSQDWVVR